MFAVGELIASGYCSLVSSGGPPPPGIDVAPLVRPGGRKLFILLNKIFYGFI